jgi:hypothetical protein
MFPGDGHCGCLQGRNELSDFNTETGTVAGAQVSTFHSAREAKEFLVSRIVSEAQRENVPLSEVERKMLYFSETGWTLPDIMTINEAFELEYDQDEYERKVARLAVGASRRARKESREEYDDWLAAIRLLRKGDHYILVMIDFVGLRPRFDQLKLLGAGVAIAALLVFFEFWGMSLSKKYGIEAGGYAPWATAVCALVAYLVFRLVRGRAR